MPASPELWEHCKVELAESALRNGNRLRLRALGSSMLPSLWPGNEITIEKIAGRDMVPGDVVLVRNDDRFLVHRLIAILPDAAPCRFITRGDSLPQSDPPAAEHQLLGRVLEVRRGNRRFVPARRLSQNARLFAWLLCRSDTLRRLTLRAHWLWLRGIALLYAGRSRRDTLVRVDSSSH
jgi:hypothetical protein